MTLLHSMPHDLVMPAPTACSYSTATACVYTITVFKLLAKYELLERQREVPERYFVLVCVWSLQAAFCLQQAALPVQAAFQASSRCRSSQPVCSTTANNQQPSTALSCCCSRTATVTYHVPTTFQRMTVGSCACQMMSMRVYRSVPGRRSCDTLRGLWHRIPSLSTWPTVSDQVHTHSPLN